ncbi:MAG: hypothetical protein AAGI51_12295, partial [Pseudomonadota bacterium]
GPGRGPGAPCARPRAMESPSVMGVTLVIPFRLTAPAPEAWRRLRAILAARPPQTPVIVADDTADAALAARTEALLTEAPAARRLAVAEGADAPFSIGRLRDRGAEAAEPGHVLFHDVDFAAPRAFYDGLSAAAAEGTLAEDPHAFACVPVWFLSRWGAMAWRAAPGATWRSLVRAGDGTHPLANRLVRGSSAMLLNREGLLSLGGHSPRFEGHGAEDFELLHRLALRRPLGPLPPRYAEDFGSRDRGEAGFRAYFARAAAPLLARGLVMAHLWHPPRRADARYYAARARNFALLKDELARAQPPEAGPQAMER